MIDMYPSRRDEQPRVYPRQEPVAWRPWSSEAPLSRDDYESWCRDGFLILSDVFSDEEVSLLQAEMENLREAPEVCHSREAITEPTHNQLRSLFAPHRHSAMYQALMQDDRLLEIARYLLDSELYVHQARVNFKPGFYGQEFFWHSDFETWHTEDGLPRMRTLSVSILLTDNSELNGPLMLIPGSHREYISCVGKTPENHHLQSLKRQQIGTPDKDNLARMAREGGIRTATGKAGTVILFDCNTLHGSSSNISPWPRSNIFFVYNSVANKPEQPFAARQPRPNHIGERRDFTPLRAHRPQYSQLLRRSPLERAS